jgi:hypothetical protein
MQYARGMINSYKMLIRLGHRWEDNIRLDLQEIVWDVVD